MRRNNDPGASAQGPYHYNGPREACVRDPERTLANGAWLCFFSLLFMLSVDWELAAPHILVAQEVSLTGIGVRLCISLGRSFYPVLHCQSFSFNQLLDSDLTLCSVMAQLTNVRCFRVTSHSSPGIYPA